MDRYEILILTVPEITEDETKSLERKLNSIVKDAKGSIISFERWGKYRLAYSIKKNDYGVYFLARFEIDKETSVLEDIKTLFAIKLHDIVSRHMVSRLEAQESLAYHRPPSLEETPARDVGSFLKENKMESFLSSFERGGSGAKRFERRDQKAELNEPQEETAKEVV